MGAAVAGTISKGQIPDDRNPSAPSPRPSERLTTLRPGPALDDFHPTASYTTLWDATLHPDTVGDRRTTLDHQPDGGHPGPSSPLIDQRPTLRRAGCAGTRTSGSEGGGEQTTARTCDTAARLRPYIECVRRTSRTVRRRHNGDMCLRWTAAGMLEAEQQFRRVIGHRNLAKLDTAVERDIAAKRAADTTYTHRHDRGARGRRYRRLR